MSWLHVWSISISAFCARWVIWKGLPWPCPCICSSRRGQSQTGVTDLKSLRCAKFLNGSLRKMMNGTSSKGIKKHNLQYLHLALMDKCNPLSSSSRPILTNYQYGTDGVSLFLVLNKRTIPIRCGRITAVNQNTSHPMVVELWNPSTMGIVFNLVSYHKSPRFDVLAMKRKMSSGQGVHGIVWWSTIQDRQMINWTWCQIGRWPNR